MRLPVSSSLEPERVVGFPSELSGATMEIEKVPVNFAQAEAVEARTNKVASKAVIKDGMLGLLTLANLSRGSLA